MPTIEQHYNDLREAAADLRKRREALTGNREASPRVAEGVAHYATVIAAERWPETRAMIAALGNWMPPGPIKYSHEWGNEARSYSGGRVWTSRSAEDEDDREGVLDLAEERLLVDVERDLRAAEAAFESYRRAVEQGVAIAPADEDGQE